MASEAVPLYLIPSLLPSHVGLWGLLDAHLLYGWPVWALRPTRAGYVYFFFAHERGVTNPNALRAASGGVPRTALFFPFLLIVLSAANLPCEESVQRLHMSLLLYPHKCNR